MCEPDGRRVLRKFNIPGLQLGLRYEGSPIVATEAGVPPADLPNDYLPTARPGARAPHIWLDGKSIFDLFARDFTLLCFNESNSTERAWTQAAAAMGLPLAVVSCASAEARALYGADCVLIRPDHHVAWRGDAMVEPGAVLAMACGHSISSARILPDAPDCSTNR